MFDNFPAVFGAVHFAEEIDLENLRQQTIDTHRQKLLGGNIKVHFPKFPLLTASGQKSGEPADSFLNHLRQYGGLAQLQIIAFLQKDLD
ncbi:hypothetical protein D3C73_1377580 [compost metagenome]